MVVRVVAVVVSGWLYVGGGKSARLGGEDGLGR